QQGRQTHCQEGHSYQELDQRQAALVANPVGGHLGPRSYGSPLRVSGQPQAGWKANTLPMGSSVPIVDASPGGLPCNSTGTASPLLSSAKTRNLLGQGPSPTGPSADADSARLARAGGVCHVAGDERAEGTRLPDPNLDLEGGGRGIARRC